MQDTPQKQFVCRFFVNLSNLRTQSNGDFYEKFYLAIFMYSESCFVYYNIFWPQYNQKFTKIPNLKFCLLGGQNVPKQSHFFLKFSAFHS